MISRSSRSRLVGLCALGSLGLAALPTAAQSGAVLEFREGTESFDLPFNTVEFELTNTSPAGISITSVSLTVGDAFFNFDELYLSRELFTGGTGVELATLVIGDRVQDTVYTDLFQYDFSGFVSGLSFRGQFDIDQDNGNFVADSRTVLFNNGDLPNAVLTVTYSNGDVQSLTLPDGGASATAFRFVVPGPGSAALIALGGAGLLRRRR